MWSMGRAGQKVASQKGCLRRWPQTLRRRVCASRRSRAALQSRRVAPSTDPYQYLLARAWNADRIERGNGETSEEFQRQYAPTTGYRVHRNRTSWIVHRQPRPGSLPVSIQPRSAASACGERRRGAKAGVCVETRAKSRHPQPGRAPAAASRHGFQSSSLVSVVPLIQPLRLAPPQGQN